MKKVIFRWENIKWSLLATGLVFAINFFIPSQTNGFKKGLNFSCQRAWDNEHAEVVFNSRYDHSEFRRRPVVLEGQKWMHSLGNIPYQFSFNLINYCSLFVLFLILPALLNSIDESAFLASRLQLFFLVSMPVLFAFLGSINVYDDLVQYLFLVLFLIFLFRRQHLLSALFFTLACITRETSLIYLVIVVAFFWLEKPDRFLLKALIWIWPVPLYFLFLYFYLPPDLKSELQVFLQNDRFTAWFSNFGDWRRIRESTTVLWVMTGLYVGLLLEKYKKQAGEKGGLWCLVLLGFVLVNALLVSVSGLLREARLLMVPLLIVLPFVHKEWLAALDSLKKRLKHRRWRQELPLILLGALVAFLWYTPLTKGTGYIFKAYVMVYTWLSVGQLAWIEPREHKKT